MTKRIRTDLQISRLKPPASGQVEHFDMATPGLALRLSMTGTRSWTYHYRFNGQLRRDTLGRYTTTIETDGSTWGPRQPLTLASARRVAERIAELAAAGDDPRDHAEAAREAVAVARANTFAKAVEEYIEHEAIGRKGNRYAHDTKLAILRNTKEWHEKPVANINARMIGKRLRSIRDGDNAKGIRAKPYMANRIHAYLATFFRWCAKPDVALIPLSPMMGIDRPFDGEEVRDRVFDDDELRALWLAADKIGGVGGAYLKVLMLTGKRKSALAAMRWDELDKGWYWTPPVDLRKRRRNKRVHGLPLPKLAQRILKPLRPDPDDKQASPYVFPGRLRDTHLYPGSDLSDDIKKHSGVSDFFYHALRHTLETRGAQLRIPPHIRDLLMDHVPARGSGRGYDHYSYREELDEALERWAAHLERIVSPQGAAVLR